MDTATLPPISPKDLEILLLQIAGLLFLCRLLAEVMRRLGQPAVIGELLAGIILGPTILGHYAPNLFLAVFPHEARQFHLLEVISNLGLILLLLLTGLETDVRVMRRLGRPAFMASAFGVIIPFASGLVLGLLLPARYLADPGQRAVFAAFIATAMAISALPVIAKILIDLNLMKRNLGVVILSAGVVDDTVGWLVLSVIAGIATAGGFSFSSLAFTCGALAAFLVVMRWVVYPVFSRTISYVNRNVPLVGADLSLILVFTLLCAAATDAIGVHAVFGAFVFGLLVRQLPRVKASTLSTIEIFVLSALSPIFFAFVGLKVNLWTLSGWKLPLLVLGIAVGGKIVGCYVGGRLGKLARWEALALGFGMNARGAMGLIVALIGLSLGLLTQEMYAIIVLVAVITSFMAPLLLRAVMSKLPVTEEERRRLEPADRTLLLPTGALRILIPTAGGANASAAFALAAPIVRAHDGTLTALYVDSSRTHRWWMWWRNPARASLAGRNLDTHLADAAERLGDQQKRLVVRRMRSVSPTDAILDEAARDYDLVLIGAAPRHLVSRSAVGDVVSRLRVPVVIVRGSELQAPPRFQRVIVPLDGSVFARAAAEFAFLYAAAAGSQVTLFHVINEARVTTGALAAPELRASHAIAEFEAESLENRIRSDFDALAATAGVVPRVRVLASGDPAATIIEQSHIGYFDLLVLGAENKLLAQPLFFGQGTASIVERAGCTTAVVVPRLA
ncbi:MAG TPA: cation:proton antiporter [Gemmatimonadaceae bacterium]|jgi:Kef-type K+ transport system membrane component KefB/nucleotide-binding universal stress UspA family protein